MLSPHTPEMQAASVIDRDSIEQHSEEIETPLTPTVHVHCTDICPLCTINVRL